MQDFNSDRYGHSDFPVSHMRPDSSVKSALAEKLSEFEKLELAPEDEGFLRLAKMILEPAESVENAETTNARPGAHWDGDGLIS